MKRNQRSIRRICKTFLPFALALVCFQGAPNRAIADNVACEVRGVWLNPPAFDSEAKQKDTLQKIHRANLNTIFLLAPPIADNRGWSTHEAFSSVLREAKLKGMSVHAWIANLHRVPGGVDFTLHQEQAKQVQWAMDLLAGYPALDGIHLDYIRYKKWEDTQVDKMASVSRVVRLIYQAIKKDHPGRFLTAAVFSSTPNDSNYRREYVPPWFRIWMQAHPKNAYAGRPSRKNYVPHGFKYQQDAVGWLMGGFIDGIIPMEYTMDDSRWQGNAKNWLSFRDGNPSGISIGLGWLREKGKPDRGYDAPGIVRKIKFGREAGFKGFVIFQLSAFRPIDESLVDALSVDSAINDFDAPFKTPVKSCLLSSEGPGIQPAQPH